MGHYSCLLVVEDLKDIKETMDYYCSENPDPGKCELVFQAELEAKEIKERAWEILKDLEKAEGSTKNLVEIIETRRLIEKEAYGEVVVRRDGGTIGTGGAWGYESNVNAVCDWWQIGLNWMRWRLKPGATGIKAARLNIMSGTSPLKAAWSKDKLSKHTADIAQKKDIDLAETKRWTNRLEGKRRGGGDRKGEPGITIETYYVIGEGECWGTDGDEKCYLGYIEGLPDELYLVLVDSHM